MLGMWELGWHPILCYIICCKSNWNFHPFLFLQPPTPPLLGPPTRVPSCRYTHISDVFIVAIMALVVKFYSFNDGLFVGTLLAMSVFTVRYSGSQAGVRTSGDARGVDRRGAERRGWRGWRGQWRREGWGSM